MDTFSAIAEPSRRKIIELLAQRGQLSAGDIAAHFQSSAPAISQHLQVLKDANAVFVTREAQRRMYSLNPEPLQALGGWLYDLTNQWEQRLDKLESILKKEKDKSVTITKPPSRKGKR